MASILLERIEEWRRKLLDLTNRNQLVSCKIGPRSAICLEYPSVGEVWSGLLGGADLTFAWKRELVPDANESDDNDSAPQLSLFGSKEEGLSLIEPRIPMERCLESRRLTSNHLLTDLQDRALGNRLNRMSLNARTALSEQGVNVLFVAFGFLRWFEAEHSDEPHLSPLLLVPVCLERNGATAPWKLSLYEDEITPNFCLRELMKRDFRLELPEVDPQALLDDDQARERYESAVRDAVGNESGWEVLSDAVLGQFSFQKLAMYDDYGRHATEIAEHEHCRRIAGDDSTPPPFAVAIPSPARFDAEVHPSKLHTILPCDSSQLEAILAIKSGASLVLDGPPGTGKSQTIANVIAECLADGKTVLFVSEKAAALEVVKQRLNDRNLGDFALNCHSHKASKKEIVTELGRCLNLPGEEYASRDGDLKRLYQQRERLNSYVRALHTPQPKLGTSVFDIHGRLAALANGTVSRCNIPNVLQMDAATLRDILDRLQALDDCRRVIEEFAQHPWRGCMQTAFSLAFEDEARNRLGRMAEHLSKINQELQPLVTAGLLASAPTLAEVEDGLKNVGKLLHAPSVPMSWLNGHPRAIAEAILRIAEWSSAFQATRQKCNMFVDEAVDDLWLLGEGGMIEPVDDKWSSGLRPHSATTVRELHSHISSLSYDLRSLADLSNDVEEAGIAVLDALKIPTGDAQHPTETLLIDIGPKPQASGALSRVWLNAAQSTIAGESLLATLIDEDEVNAAQVELERIFVSAAFGKRGRNVVRDVRKFRRIWKAVFPKWRLMRKKIEPLYRDKSSRRPSALVRDVEQLRAFLSDSDQYAREVDAHDESLIRDEVGRVCWQFVRDGFQASERLQRLIRVPNQQLINAISTQQRVDRVTLRIACEKLTAVLNAPAQPESSDSPFESGVPTASRFQPSNTAKVIALHEHLKGLSNQVSRLVRLNAEARQAAEELESMLSVALVEWPMQRVKSIVEVGRLFALEGNFRREWFDDTQRQRMRDLVKRLSATDHDLMNRRQDLESRLKPIAFGPEGREAAQRFLPFHSVWKRWLPQWRPVSRQMQSLYIEPTPPSRATLFRDATELNRFHAEIAQFYDECHAIESWLIRDVEQKIMWQAMLDGIRVIELLQGVGGVAPEAMEINCDSEPTSCARVHNTSLRLGAAICALELELQNMQRSLAQDDDLGEPGFAWRSALKMCDSARSLVQMQPILCGISVEIQQATEWSAELRESTACLGRALTVPVQDPSVVQLTTLIELGRVISETEVFRPVWFEAAKVRDFREVSARLEATDEQLGIRRRDLEQRFGPDAFGVKGQQLTARYEEIQSVWQSLFPALQSLRRQAKHMYRGEVSRSPKVFFQEMRRLSRHHLQSAILADEKRVFDRAFIRNKDGTVSLQSVVGAIDAVRSLKAGRSTPAAIRDQHRGAPRIDLLAIVLGCEHLKTLLSSFEQQFSVVRKRFECSDTGRIAGARQKPTASAYAHQLRASATALAEHADKLSRVMGLLRDECDVRTDELSGKIKTLQKVRDLRDRIRQQHVEIQTAIVEDGIPEQRDWKDSADRAHFLKLLLDKHRDALPAAIANVLVESQHRSQMVAAYDAANALMSDRFRSDSDFLRRLFPDAEPVSSGLVICQTTVSMLSEWLRFLVSQLSQLHEWITFRQIEGELTRLGVGEVLNEIITRDYPVEQAATAFLARLYRLWLDEVYREDPALGGFRAEDHERIIEEFRTLDRQAIESGTRQIRAKLLSDPERPHTAVSGAPPTSEFGILLREINKKKRHLPLRQLFARVPNLLVRLKPCLMMSPLAVSTYLESPEFQFDVVIFDEASQVLPWDAIGAVYRGRQLVVAGDQKQLPPSTFFDRMVNNDDDFEDADDLADFESVLDVLCSIGLPRKRLRWHYRSRREPLIAFSNHHFYDGDLVTFPSPHDLDGSTAVRFVHVPEGRWRPKAGFNPLEAKRTAELVLEHFQKHGSRSLGVITFNLRQQLAVLDELTELRKSRPDLEAFFREDRPEQFFVKNLENVQGDERDRIILSVAYGLNETTGRDSMSFGPLNRAGGERRLNVAVTRSREAITLVSSIRSDYIDLRRTKSRGARLLRAYLDYAEHGPSAMASESVETGRDFESPFEEAVAQAIINLGFEVRTQIGCSGFRIDLAIVHPEHPGRYVLGIECDGATYHRTATARDRDRIRQEVLEDLGWRGRLIRIWSTDWIRNPAHQIERIAKAVRKALLLPATSLMDAPEGSPPSPDAEPIFRIREFRDGEPTPHFTDIEDVPDDEIARVLMRLTVSFGAIPREDLIKSTTRKLGFGRTGTRISARIESVVQRLIQQGRLYEAGDERLGATI